MNKKLLNFGAVVIALSMTACNQDDFASNSNELKEIEGVAQTSEVVSGYKASRTVVSEEGDEFSLWWAAGESIGVLEEGQTYDCAFTLPIVSSKWNWENMGVLVIVSAKDSNNRWDVVNSAYCSVEDKSKAYEYVE